MKLKLSVKPRVYPTGQRGIVPVCTGRGDGNGKVLILLRGACSCGGPLTEDQ